MTKVSQLPRFRQQLMLCLLLLSICQGAFEYHGPGWSTGAAHIKVVGDGNLDGYTLNPALMDTLQSTLVGISHSRVFDGLSLNVNAVELAWTPRRTPMVMGVRMFGDKIYQELTANLGIPFFLRSTFHAGVVFNYHSLQFDDRVIHRGVTFSPGMSVWVRKNVLLGSCLEHLIQFPEDGMVAQRFHLGLAYFARGLELLVAMEKEGDLPMDLKLAAQANWGHSIAGTVGYRQATNSLSLGWKIQYGQFSLYYTWMGHPYLPASHGLGLELGFP